MVMVLYDFKAEGMDYSVFSEHFLCVLPLTGSLPKEQWPYFTNVLHTNLWIEETSYWGTT